jgi:histidine ammonia-lyase
LHAKEGLGLINGTQTTTSLALKAWFDGSHLLKHANLAAAFSIEALRGSHKIFDPKIAVARNHQGAIKCAEEISSWIAGTTEVSRSHENCGRVQDPYSLRCAPQVHGAIWEALDWSERILKNEINSSTDNPLVFADDETSLSGGNFHALYTARVSDNLASALTTLASISERRTALLMSKEISLLPAFLTPNGGLNSGFMMAQVTAAALVSESKTLSFPASVDSIPTSDDREDHVSMGVGAGIKLQQIVQNLAHVLSIEILAAAQAIDLLRPLKTSTRLERVHSLIRKSVSKLERDRNLSIDFKNLSTLIEGEHLVTT